MTAFCIRRAYIHVQSKSLSPKHVWLCDGAWERSSTLITKQCQREDLRNGDLSFLQNLSV